MALPAGNGSGLPCRPRWSGLKVVACGQQLLRGDWWVGMVNEALPYPSPHVGEVHCPRAIGLGRGKSPARQHFSGFDRHRDCPRAMGLDLSPIGPDTHHFPRVRLHIARGQQVCVGSLKPFWIVPPPPFEARDCPRAMYRQDASGWRHRRRSAPQHSDQPPQSEERPPRHRVLLPE